MAGYANRLLTVDFPDLADADDKIYVAIRNPKLVPPGELSNNDVVIDENGQPVDPDAATAAMYETIAKLITAWRVYDATDMADDQALLPSPATADSVAKLPVEIINRLADEIKQAVNPH